MNNLEILFSEFDCTTIDSLLSSISTRIDWYTEVLCDDPWDTYAQGNKDYLENLYDEIYSEYVQSNND